MPTGQPTVRKKMAALHFTIILCEPNRAITTHRKTYFGEIHPGTNKIVYARFEVFRPFLCVFMIGFRIFVRKELSVNVPVVIFFDGGLHALSNKSLQFNYTDLHSRTPSEHDLSKFFQNLLTDHVQEI